MLFMRKQLILLLITYTSFVFGKSISSYSSVQHEPDIGATQLQNVEATHENCSCQNGGICLPLESSFFCFCKPPYFGVVCEKEWIETTPESENNLVNDSIEEYQWTTNEPSKIPEIFNMTTDIYQWTSNYTSEFPEIFNMTTDIYQSTSNYSSEFPEISNMTTDTYRWTSNYSSELPDNFNKTADLYQSTSKESSEFTRIFNETTNFSNDNNTTFIPPNVTDLNDSTNETTSFTSNYSLTTIQPGFCTKDTDCSNKGICSNSKCQCRQNFGGYWCERNLLCERLQPFCSVMRADCKIVAHKAICDCPPNEMYHPKSGMCEDICNPWRCLHGRCEIDGRTYNCICDTGYKGQDCNERIQYKADKSNVWLYVMICLVVLTTLLLIQQVWLVFRYQKLSTNISDAHLAELMSTGKKTPGT